MFSCPAEAVTWSTHGGTGCKLLTQRRLMCSLAALTQTNAFAADDLTGRFDAAIDLPADGGADEMAATCVESLTHLKFDPSRSTRPGMIVSFSMSVAPRAMTGEAAAYDVYGCSLEVFRGIQGLAVSFAAKPTLDGRSGQSGGKLRAGDPARSKHQDCRSTVRP